MEARVFMLAVGLLFVSGQVSKATATSPIPSRPNSRPETQLVELKADSNTKADRMCREYSRYVYWEVDSPASSLKNEKYNKTFCAMEEQNLLVNGVRAEPMQFPHMAALGYGDENNIQWMCGGTLISERYILTVAHCLSALSSGLVKWVRLGDLNLERSDDVAEPITMVVQERIKHPGYKPPAIYNDIALLRLQEDVPFSKFIRPACLYTKPGNPPRISNAIASGWGKINWDDDVHSSDLLRVVFSFQPTTTCNETFRSTINTSSRLKYGITTDTMICAGVPLGKMDRCGGESGSPLQVKLTDPYCMYSVIGLTSFGIVACGIGNNSEVFTRVSFYVPWIEGIVWPDQ